MDFQTKGVGQIHEANRRRTKRIPILGEVDGPRPQVGFNTEHWSGRRDALVRPPGIKFARWFLEMLRTQFPEPTAADFYRMQMMASGVMGASVEKQWESHGTASVDFATDAFSLQLHTNAFTEQYDTDTLDADLNAEVAAGGGYSTGGQALANETVVVASGAVNFDADDEVWTPNTSITGRYAAVICDAPDVVICALDFGSDVTSDNGDYTVAFGTSPAAFWSHDTTP